MLDITVHDYQAAMDKLTRKSRSLQNKLLLLIGQLCNYATEVHRMEVVKPSSYLVLDGIESKSREIFFGRRNLAALFFANQMKKFLCTAREVLFYSPAFAPRRIFLDTKRGYKPEDCYIFSAGSKTGAGRNRLIPLISRRSSLMQRFFYSSKGMYFDHKPPRLSRKDRQLAQSTLLPSYGEWGSPSQITLAGWCRIPAATDASLAGPRWTRMPLKKMIGHANYRRFSGQKPMVQNESERLILKVPQKQNFREKF